MKCPAGWLGCLLIGSGLVVAGCASGPARTGSESAGTCQAQYAVLDEAIKRAGVGEPEFTRIAGFPYLRVNRFLASFRESAIGGTAVWMEALRQLDVDARRTELRNLGWPERRQHEQIATIQRCGLSWAQQDLAQPERVQALRQAAVVPSSYIPSQRVFGIYPFTQMLMKSGVKRYQQEVLQTYVQPLTSLPVQGRLLHWQPAPPGGERAGESAVTFSGWRRDALGRWLPPNAAQLERVAAQHAPHWWIDSSGPADYPGTPVWQENHWTIDSRQPVVYYRLDHSYWQGKVLPQISYLMWFSARPATSSMDAYAGHLDGVIWRVTLDERGQPWLYDSIHACGCYHQYFPLWPLGLRALTRNEEPVLLPQAVVPRGEVALRLAAGTHRISRVVAASAVPIGNATMTYRLQPYAQLRTLTVAGGTRNLFGPDGLARGSERQERWWLWPSGVRSPGAMRAWGHHATAFVGEAHFDDPGLLDRHFSGVLNLRQ